MKYKNISWLPIETAPRDGTSVLLYDSEEGIGVGHWVEGDDEFGVDRFWVAFTTTCSSPTHWMPLPEPPQK